VIYNHEARFPGNSAVNLLVHRLVNIKHLAALLTSEMVMLISPGIEPAQGAAKAQLRYFAALA
jgi:hypothetical protein